MENKQIKLFHVTSFVLLSISLISYVVAEEVIIQKKISFEKCLKVIKASENKLSIAPEIKNVSEKAYCGFYSSRWYSYDCL